MQRFISILLLAGCIMGCVGCSQKDEKPKTPAMTYEYSTYEVLKAIREIPAGAEITEQNFDIYFGVHTTTNDTVYKNGIDVDKADSIIGMYAQNRIASGDIPSAADFAADNPNAAPSNDDSEQMKAYLEEKYNRTFTLISKQSETCAFATEGFADDIVVYKTSNLIQRYGFDQQLYNDNFADNGYAVLKQDKLVEYYEQFVDEAYGTHRILVQYSTPVLPSSVTLDTPVEDCIKLTDEQYFKVYILTDEYPDDDVLEATQQTLKDTGDPVALRVAHLKAGNQNADKETQIPAYLLLAMLSDSDTLLSADINMSTTTMTPEQYLEDKYGIDFSGSLWSLLGLNMFSCHETDEDVMVMTKDEMLDYSLYDPELFTEAYADNGYYAFNKGKMEEYFGQFFGNEFGTRRVIVLCNAMAFPSAMDVNMPIEDAFKEYPAYTACAVYLLADNIPDAEVFETAQSALENTGIHIELYVANVPASLQDSYNTISVLNLSTVHKAVLN